MENLYRVSASSKPVSVAGAIAGSIRDGHSVALQAIGAGAVNQAVKAAFRNINPGQCEQPC